MIGASVRRYTTEGKDKRFIAGAFARYVSPKVVKQILADPARLALGGERRDVTLFFSDLQGFTSISEGMSPQELVAFLNEYTTLMADVITGPGLDGTIDKYIGDSVMAFWGAPLPQPDHARRGLLAALACQERLRPFCDELVARGGPRLVTRIGLNSGTCVVGNMGSRDRFDYTAIGDTVNQASRLEGINKVYGTLDHRLREHLAGGAGGGLRAAAGSRARQGQGGAGGDLRGDGAGGRGDRGDARAGRRLRRGARRLPGAAVAADDRTGRGDPAHDARRRPVEDADRARPRLHASSRRRRPGTASGPSRQNRPAAENGR